MFVQNRLELIKLNTNGISTQTKVKSLEVRKYMLCKVLHFYIILRDENPTPEILFSTPCKFRRDISRVHSENKSGWVISSCLYEKDAESYPECVRIQKKNI